MKTLIWKEWREQRLFFFLAVGIIVLSRVVPYFLPEKMLDYYLYMGACCLIFPILFSLLLGATSFNGEFIRNTKPFLLSQPLTSRRLFWVKFLSGLIIFFVLALIVQGVFLLLPFKEKIIFNTLTKTDFQSIFQFILPIFLSLLVLYSTACFSSLLLKNSLPAIICTPFVLIFGVLLVLPLSIALFLVSPNAYIFAVLIVSVLIAVFLTLGFQTWQKAIVKDVSPAKTIFAITAVILLISFGSHAIANLVASQKLNKTIQQVKAEGIKLTPQEVIPPPVPDKENAALIYQQAFDLADKLEATHKSKENSLPGGSWGAQLEKLTPEQKRTASEIINDPEFIKLYTLIEKAINLPSCRFNLQYDKGPNLSLLHHTKIRSLARLVAARVYFLVQEGRWKEALESAKTGLRLGDSLASEPFFISQLVRIASDNIALDSFRQLFDRTEVVISTKYYQDLISEIDKKDKRITKGLEGELPIADLYPFKLALGETRTTFQDIELSTSKKTINLSVYMKMMNSGRNIGLQTLWKIYGGYLGRPILKGDYAFSIRAYSNLVELSRKPFFQVKNAVDEWDRNLFPRGAQFSVYKHIISSMFLPALSISCKQQAQYIANLESFKLALALKIYKQKHGYYPDKIASLSSEVIPELPLDPFTGKDYIYHKEGKGFLLYSVGPNEKDDNGIYDQKQYFKCDDIAWKVLN
jgi:ABC-type transport system involved in multi-copper enzyme maturation permease subunit